MLKRHKCSDTPNARHEIIIVITKQAGVVNRCWGGPDTSAVMTEIVVNFLRLLLRIYIYIYMVGARGDLVVKALRYKSAGRGSDF